MKPSENSLPNSQGGLRRNQLQDLARAAWRNNARCIGRLYWQSLELLDARSASTCEEIFEACVHHLKFSTNGGRIRHAITVFAQAQEESRGIRIWNPQLIRYAGYRAADGTVLGDPLLVDLTNRLFELGWKPPRTRTQFDVLPLVISIPGKAPRIFDLPKDAVLEVPLSHPDHPWFEDLKLKWHALPVISDMALVSGKDRFTAAPFSGHYMGTEIGSRNLGDEARYNLLPTIARRMGLATSSKEPLWKDRALIELNAAVLHSFKLAKVTVVDHHAASAQFMKHLDRERKLGRVVPGDWSWLVPPLSGSSSPLFHRYYDTSDLEPAFVQQRPAWID